MCETLSLGKRGIRTLDDFLIIETFQVYTFNHSDIFPFKKEFENSFLEENSPNILNWDPSYWIDLIRTLLWVIKEYPYSVHLLWFTIVTS